MKRLTTVFYLLACCLCSATVSQVSAQDKAQAQINILTYNVHNCIGVDKERDYERIANVIRRAHPDVVALQELDSVTLRNNGVFTLDTLRKLTGLHGLYASAIPYQNGSYGIGILSQERPLRYYTVPMPGREEKRTMLVAEFKDYIFCATHQSLTQEDQIASVPLLVQAVNDSDKPVFMAGDMNSHPGDKPQQLLRDSFITLNDTADYTFPANHPDCTLDYIYVRKDGQHRCIVLQTKVIDEPTASDHRPVQVIVEVQK